ncbi:F-box/LRR-repeat protein 15-like [Bidens hawaiensis]|uniref:F-box/LRR-repeat protein 15-like n=1 Tax=Bidens hawaiensis TaxID=980011 RepID=UPI004049C144
MALLELKGCGVLSEASINCPLLTSLDASFCSHLKDDCLSTTTASCPLIESLILMSCTSVGSDGLKSLCRLHNLTSLDLSYTFLTNLQPIFDSCWQLKVILKWQACKYLTDSSLKPLYKDEALPKLRELDLSYGSLCQTSIEELLACCTQLTHVSLNGCVNMHDLNWSFTVDHVYQPFLQNLNCVVCPNIKKVLISSITQFSNLSSLNMSLSAYLKEVDVACYNLCFLNLSNCSSSEILKLDCPRLTSLFLQSCNISEAAVESAISNCSMLETLDVRFCQKISPVSVGKLRTACPSLKRISSSMVPV